MMSSQIWQQVIVAVIVAVAVLHFCTKYLPAAWRRQIVHFLVKRGFDEQKTAKLFKTTASCGDGCGSCGSCDTTPAAAPSDTANSTPHKRVIKLHVQR
jgi:hypothetical protein